MASSTLLWQASRWRRARLGGRWRCWASSCISRTSPTRAAASARWAPTASSSWSAATDGLMTDCLMIG
eukprot:7388988-Prymnesium_polylepis.2